MQMHGKFVKSEKFCLLIGSSEQVLSQYHIFIWINDTKNKNQP